MNKFEELYSRIRESERNRYAPQKFYEWARENKAKYLEKSHINGVDTHATEMKYFAEMPEDTLRAWIFQFLLEDES